MDEIETISTLAGYSLMTETEDASYGMGMINLKPWNERDKTAAELLEVYAERTAHIKDAEIQYFLPPTVPGFGNASGFELRLQDRTAASFQETARVANMLVDSLNSDPRLQGVTSGFQPNFPQYLLKVDLAQAAKLGVNVNEALESLQSYVGSFYSSNFIRFGQMYKVMLQASPEYRMEPKDIYSLYAKNRNGEMVPYSNFLTMERVFGPNQITRYNMFTSSLITGDAAPGVSSGEAIAAVEEIAADILPRGYALEWSGVSREEKESGGQTILIFGICLLFVYLLLAAQYESLLLPFPVILSLPAGVFGAYFVLQLAGLDNNIYAQVALVMLIGLLGKNAILNIVRGRSTHGEECVSFDVKDLPTHEVQHMGPYFMDPASVPQPFRQRVQHGKVLVVPIQEGSRKRLVLQPVQPILLRGCSTPESSKVACDDYHVLAVHLFLLREVFHPKPLKSAVCIACDIDAHDAFLQSSCSISCSTSVPFRKVTRILSFARTVTFSTSW